MTRIKDMHASGVDLLLQPGEPPESAVIARKVVDFKWSILRGTKVPGDRRRAGEPGGSAAAPLPRQQTALPELADG